MKKNLESIIVEEIKAAIPFIEQYREKNVVKHNAEAANEHGGEYSVKEKYKHRVRVVDLVLPRLKAIVEKYYELQKDEKGKDLE